MWKWEYSFFENCKNSNISKNIDKFLPLLYNEPLELATQFFFSMLLKFYWTLNIELNNKNSKNSIILSFNANVQTSKMVRCKMVRKK